MDIKQLNPFEIKSEITTLVQNFTNVNDLQDYVEQIKLLDSQNDKKTIVKLLFKELYNVKTDEASILCFLLERYASKEYLSKKLWDLLNNKVVANNVKIIAINFLRGLDSNWELDSGDELLNAEIIDAETKKLLNRALINPEIQIDFLDFLTSLSSNDKITLINSLGNDYTNDEMANILIPVFLSNADNEVGLEALKLLGESKSQLAFHALNEALDFVNDTVKPLVKKNLSILKIAGIREDNSKEFYKQILSESLPYKMCVTYPDGQGNQALIFTRKTIENKVRFVAIVIDDYHGIRDCFGFYEISQFECDKIIERFYNKDVEIYVEPKILKTVLLNAEKISKEYSNNWLMPYEYVCWKNLFVDIDYDNGDFESILSNKITLTPIEAKDLDIIYEAPFYKKWFLNAGYSDEFEELCALDIKDYDATIEKYLDKIFYPEERKIWLNRILLTAYLELGQENINSAKVLYRLYHNEKLHNDFFKNILKRSLYEYYVSLKFNTELNNGRYSLNELDKIIKQIEDVWVCTK